MSLDNNLKLYIADFGWRGNEIVIASNREEALEFMKDNTGPYERSWDDYTPQDLYEYPIVEGYVTGNLGDS